VNERKNIIADILYLKPREINRADIIHIKNNAYINRPGHSINSNP
tara:strand:+ start:375 stop:509 length:135 start_codon:yes stop_codon:yes gene_type:complete